MAHGLRWRTEILKDCCRESCNVAHLGDIELQIRKTQADLSYPMDFSVFLWCSGALISWSNFSILFLSCRLDTIIWMLQIICEQEDSPVLCRMHQGATVKLVESSTSKPAMHVSSAQRRQCHSRSPKKGYEKAWHCPLILHMANTFLEMCFICVCFISWMHLLCFCTHHVSTPFPWSAQRLSIAKDSMTDFPAPAVPSTRAHHHPTVILEPKERSSTIAKHSNT